MQVYFFMLAVPSMLAILYGKRSSGPTIAIVFLLFVFLIGFRFNVGMDWNNYEDIHKYIRQITPFDILTGSEPLSVFVFWMSASLGWGSLLSNIASACMLMVGVLSFARRTPNPWLAVVAATPYLIIAFGMSGIRQAMAAGILLYTMSVWEERRTLRRSAYVVLASLFHTSAMMALVFVLWDMRVRIQVKIGVTVLTTPILFYVYQVAASYSENVQFYQDTYLSGGGSVVSPGALFHIALVGLPAALYFIYRRRFAIFEHTDQTVFMGAWAVIAVFCLYFFSSTGASRLSAYLYFVPMAVYSGLPRLFARKYRLFLISIIIAIHFIILFTWLVYANNSQAHIPYRNIVFENTAFIAK